MKRSEFIKNWRSKDLADLQVELVAVSRQLMGERFMAAVRQTKDSTEKRKLRRNIARLKTLIGEKEA